MIPDVMTRELAHRILNASRYLPTGCIIARPSGVEAGVEVWPTLLTLEDLETIIAHEAAHGGPNAASNIAMARQAMEDVTEQDALVAAIEAERLARAKELHARTRALLGDCVQALAESWDDPERAIEWMRVRMLCR